MKRFLLLVGVAVVAAAMYVAASPASQQSSGPTAKQFRALKAQVATLSKKVKTAQNELDALALAYVHCSLPSEIGIAQFTVGVTPQHTTALDLAGTSPPTYDLTPFNSADSACQTLVGAAAGREHHLAGVVAHKFASRP
jgi:outer membrane murein-binding lipoprotein Lpp